MRDILGFLAACFVVVACQPAGPSSDASAGSSGVGRVAEQAVVIEPEALVGVWSFDRSCASGDGMQLDADGTASFDEWGQGTWAMAEGNRIVLTLTRWEPGVGPTDEIVVYHLDIATTITGDLTGQLARPDGSEPRGINALWCAE